MGVSFLADASTLYEWVQVRIGTDTRTKFEEGAAQGWSSLQERIGDGCTPPKKDV
jgi:hypothetical protein